MNGSAKDHVIIANYFLELVKEGSAKDVKTFYSYFSYDLNELIEENIRNDDSSNPLRAAYIRGDPIIFNQIIKLNPNLFSKNQANDRALHYALQLNDTESVILLLMNRRSRELTIKEPNPDLQQFFTDFKQLSKDEFNLKYHLSDIQCQFTLPDLPQELQLMVIENLSPGSALNSRSVCKLWRDNITKPAIMDNTFIKQRIFYGDKPSASYFLKIEVLPTVHHLCLADPKRLTIESAQRNYDNKYLAFVDDLIAKSTRDCLHPDSKKEFKDLILNFNPRKIYYWNDQLVTYALYMEIDEDFGIGIVLHGYGIDYYSMCEPPLDDDIYG